MDKKELRKKYTKMRAWKNLLDFKSRSWPWKL